MKSHISLLFLLATVSLLFSCSAPRQGAPSKDLETHETGYGKVSKRNATSSISTVERDKNMEMGNLSLIDMLRRVPGVEIQGGNSILIRGASSLTLSNEPLFVVDGVTVGNGYNSVSSINPNDVDRISVLKGPSAGIYGAQGANGVIVIKTKSGNR